MGRAVQAGESGSVPAMDCPSCGSAIRAGRMACSRCGYDRNLGRRPLGTEPRRRIRPAKAAVLAAFAVLFGLALLLPILTPAPRPPAPAPATVQETMPPAPEPAPEPSAIEDVPPPSAPDPIRAWHTGNAELDARIDGVRDKLDRNRPLYEPGETVEVRTQVGRIMRGVLVARYSDRIVVQPAEGSPDTVAFADMDIPTRVQFDPAYRRRYVEYRARQLAGPAGGL